MRWPKTQSRRGPADPPFLMTTRGRPGPARKTWVSLNTPGGNGLAGVDYPAVLKLAEKLNGFAHGITAVAVYTPGFLGAAIAHEIGHLILGANAHHPEGVMRAEWGREQFELITLGGLNFARDQAKQLQSEVKHRLSEGAQRPQVNADQP